MSAASPRRPGGSRGSSASACAVAWRSSGRPRPGRLPSVAPLSTRRHEGSRPARLRSPPDAHPGRRVRRRHLESVLRRILADVAPPWSARTDDGSGARRGPTRQEPGRAGPIRDRRSHHGAPPLRVPRRGAGQDRHRAESPGHGADRRARVGRAGPGSAGVGGGLAARLAGAPHPRCRLPADGHHGRALHARPLVVAGDARPGATAGHRGRAGHRQRPRPQHRSPAGPGRGARGAGRQGGDGPARPAHPGPGPGLRRALRDPHQPTGRDQGRAGEVRAGGSPRAGAGARSCGATPWTSSCTRRWSSCRGPRRGGCATSRA